MSIAIDFNHVVKKYGDQAVIPGLSIKVKEGEFFTLLGPSGCGKTTLLRMVAGFNSIEGGEIKFDEKVMNDVKPSKRNIGMVFQNYAIFPHLSVKKNIAFGLENRKTPKAEIERRVDEILRIVQIEKFKDRLPENLSGGQQQRVALARAIVINPDVLLMDEPLSNLDAKLRIELRNAIRKIQKEVGITTVYVTHDQEEAMAVSDRIAVMKDGYIQHAGTPQNIYHRPANLFVSSFIGRSNILNATLFATNDKTEIVIHDKHRVVLTNIRQELIKSTKTNVQVCVRPEEFLFTSDTNGLKGKVQRSSFLGLNTNYFIELESGETVEVIQESDIDTLIPEGSVVYLKLNQAKVNVFNEDGSVNLTEGVKNDAAGEVQSEVNNVAI
ncbi:ABC transporter ATP-binding protein [Paenalkalicoccus suaedae]|uniref:ABC transporter ATP-binding protein n=1 Tax=Paenalkalicoccus suaedae TaxID=2592382 RepID=A0A859FHK6_9BACI|nr:ABC transporter ATP-binding protein [Paenalkalicoccus suaedae]QKS72561.1 ABC transporter ATP-binding protein [Paenalkalicoccus suaedae]